MIHKAVRISETTWRTACNSTEDCPTMVENDNIVTCRACAFPVPDYAKLVGGDNHVVAVPRWLAIRLYGLVRRFLKGEPRSTCPAFAAEEQDECDTFKALIKEVK
jgi:hypothetical protein